MAAWLAALAGCGAAAIIAGTQSGGGGAATDGGDLAKLKSDNDRLRAAIVTLRNESLALRVELDRLVARMRPSAGVPSAALAAAHGAAEGSDAQAVARKVGDLSSQIASLSAGVLEGQPDAVKNLFDRISQLQAMGPEALPALRDSLAATTEPGAKRILIGLLVQRGGPEEQAFLLAQARNEGDPQVKQAMLSAAGMLRGSGQATAETEMKALAAAEDPQARAGAIRSLARLDDPEAAGLVEHALSSDGSEAVRLAALDALLSDPQRREQALQTASRDSSARIRGIAECRERMATIEGEIAGAP